MKHVRGLFQKYLKNRSSKDLYFAGLCGVGSKPAIWGWSNEALRTAASGMGKGNVYDRELLRRAKNAAKRKTPRPGANTTNAVAPYVADKK